MKRLFFIMLFAVLASLSPASYMNCPLCQGSRLATCNVCCRGPCQQAFGVENAVCVTKKGKKYHRAGCRVLKNAEVQKMTRTEAENKGYSPCKICKP